MTWPAQWIPTAVESWPALLRPAIAEFGPIVVWRAGGYALGYPPTWLDDTHELRAVVDALNSKEVRKMLLDASEFETVDEIAGNAPPKPGRYHALVKAVDDVKYDGKVAVTFEVLAGTVPGQEGRSITEFFATSEKAQRRLLLLAIALDLLRVGQRGNVKWRDAEGRQLIIEVETHEYMGKTRSRLNFRGIWGLDNPEATDVPRDRAMLQSANQSAKPVASTAPDLVAAEATTDGAASVDDDPWGNL